MIDRFVPQVKKSSLTQVVTCLDEKRSSFNKDLYCIYFSLNLVQMIEKMIFS